MLRAAAKNHRSVAVVCDPADYVRVGEKLREGKGSLDPALLRELAVKAFRMTARYDAAVAAIKGAQAGHYPTLDLVAQYSDQTGDSTSTLPRTDNRVGYVGLQVNVPIFAGGYVNSQVLQATAAAAEAREAYEYARDDLRLRVKREFDGLKGGISRVRALEIALKSGDQMVQSNQKGVQAGTRTILDVLIAEQQRFNTRIDLAKARYQLLVSRATLLSYVGDLNTEQIARINRVLKESVPTAM